MQGHTQHRPRYETPAGIIGLPLSDFASGKIMLSCDCSSRTMIPVRGLLKKYAGRSVGEVIDSFSCAKCGQPPASACLLSQTRLI